MIPLHHRGKSCVLLLLAICFAISLIAGGCGQKEETPGDSARIEVKAMHPIAYSSLISAEVAAQIKGMNELAIQPKVSGTITEKYVNGGDMVTAGQPLYKLDSRRYEADADRAYANLVHTQIQLENARLNLARYMELAKTGDISEQTVSTQQSTVDSLEATAEANAAALQHALEDLDDTTIYAPSDGQLSIDDVAVGSYAVAGSTKLVSMGTPDPIYAQFSVTERDYLEIIASGFNENLIPSVSLILDNGEAYPLPGKLVEADRSIETSTGNLTIKALFPNPAGLLKPGMFTRLKLTSPQLKETALLVPQSAVQQLLDKMHVLVVGDGNKSVTRVITVSRKIGDYYLVTSGLEPDDIIVVEGLSNLQGGKELSVTLVTPEEMGYSQKESKDVHLNS